MFEIYANLNIGNINDCRVRMLNVVDNDRTKGTNYNIWRRLIEEW